VSIGNYTVPPDAKQPGTGQLVATGDCRTQDVVWRNGFVYNGFSEKQGTNRKSQRSALRYLKIGSTGIVNKDITYTATGIEMYYPAVTSDGSENMYLSFSRSSKTEYASMYRTGMLLTDGAIQASNLVKAGISTNTSGRWGDYNAIANDPVDAGDVWMYAGWANSSNRWATWNAATSFGTPPVAQRYDVAETPASTPGAAFALKGNFPNPFNPVTTIHYTVPAEMHVALKVYNVIGQEVATLLDGIVNGGEHQTTWDASSVPSGVYYYRLEAGHNVSVGKMSLIK
jgi:hypothetical protein